MFRRCRSRFCCWQLLLRRAARMLFVRVNQLGYRPADVKIAVAMARERCRRSFKWSMRRRRRRYSKARRERSTKRWGEFEHHAQLDFSAFNKTGKYFVRVGGCEVVDVSHLGVGLYAELARSAAGVHAAAAVWIQPVGRCRVPFVRWPHGRWAAAGRQLCRCPRRLARCGRPVEVSADVEQCDGADAARVSVGQEQSNKRVCGPR